MNRKGYDPPLMTVWYYNLSWLLKMPEEEADVGKLVYPTRMRILYLSIVIIKRSEDLEANIENHDSSQWV